MMNAKELLTDDVRKAFLKDKQAPFLAFILCVVFGLALLSVAYTLVGTPPDHDYLQKQGDIAFGNVRIPRLMTKRSGGSKYHGHPVAYQVSFSFELSDKHYEATAWIPADCAESNKKGGDEILVLYDKLNPNHCCLATSSVPYEEIKESIKQKSKDLSSLNIIPLSSPEEGGWFYLLHIFSFLLLFGAGAVLWVRYRAKRLLNNIEVVGGTIKEIEEVEKKDILLGYKIKVTYETRKGLTVEKKFSTRKKDLPESIQPGREVRVIYNAAKPKKFFIYELYLGQPSSPQ